MITEEYLESLGVETASSNEREIRAICPVHHIVKGRPSSSAKWYMNRSTGAWICFSCQQSGSLASLIDLLNLDRSMLANMPVEIMKSTLQSVARKREAAPVEEKPKVYVSEYAFNKHPYPPKSISDHRGISLEMCVQYNVRWSNEGRHFLLPIYDFAGALMGWQQKSVGYFMNVPDDVKKSHSLFGYQQFHGIEQFAILVESPLDVVRMASLGIDGGLATYGAYVSDVQLDAVAAATRDVILAFDSDVAGLNANNHCRRELMQRSVRVRTVRYPARKHGKDPGEWPKDKLYAAIDGATTFTGTTLSVPRSLTRRP